MLAKIIGPMTACFFSAACPAHAQPSAMVDGTYRGTWSMVINLNGRCGNSASGATTATVKDRVLTRTFGPSISITATIQPDGSVSGSYGQTQLTGSVRNGHMEVALQNQFCKMQQVLDKG